MRILENAIENGNTPLVASSFRMTSKEPSTEQQRALITLQTRLDDWKNHLDKPLENCTHTNFFTFSVSPIRREHLPHEEHWVWNQSNAKLTASLFSGSVTVTLQKFNARKKPRARVRQPSFKLWIYTIDDFLPQTLFSLWCEKGREPGEAPQLVGQGKQPKADFSDLKLESFSFLKRFVSEETAQEFGWTSPPEEEQRDIFSPFPDSPTSDEMDWTSEKKEEQIVSLPPTPQNTYPGPTPNFYPPNNPQQMMEDESVPGPHYPGPFFSDEGPSFHPPFPYTYNTRMSHPPAFSDYPRNTPSHFPVNRELSPPDMESLQNPTIFVQESFPQSGRIPKKRKSSF